MDALVGFEMDSMPGDRDLLLNGAHQMHLNAPLTRLIDRFVAEGCDINRAPELPVDAHKKVEVESGRDARGIV